MLVLKNPQILYFEFDKIINFNKLRQQEKILENQETIIKPNKMFEVEYQI